MTKQILHIAIPSLNEADYLPKTIECLKKQIHSNFHIWVCVNQPNDWWTNKDKGNICINNESTLQYLGAIKQQLPNLTIIDKSSKGNGWIGKNHGVGFARKTLMDEICKHADDNDIIVSMDADVEVGSNYLSSVAELFKNNPKAVALANPYYHKLSGEEALDRPMLRYEIYMRAYTINLLRINSPYAFTAFGSVISLPVWAYKKIRGITPKTSGEDFYLLQKLRKMGKILLYNEEIVYPATRVSDRVPFGTGPAIAKSIQSQQASYPIFYTAYFDEIAETYRLFNDLFYSDIKTPMTDFLSSVFKSDDIFTPLRNNYKTLNQFINACHNKIDGLRIFQYLKCRSLQCDYSDYDAIKELLILLNAEFDDNFSFITSPIEKLNELRNLLYRAEGEMRKQKFDFQGDLETIL
ncbi:MAG: glycosyltransferase family 2 protein [Bacteroidetes bacterium]|nr:glycosyltransferase family 2 protein [Bacteroidota bacterium]